MEVLHLGNRLRGVPVTIDCDLLLFGLGLFFGWLITLLYYRIAKKKAKEESRISEQRHIQMQVSAEEYEKVEHQASIMLRAIEDAGIASFVRNKRGEFIGLEHQGQLHAFTESKLVSPRTVIKGDAE